MSPRLMKAKSAALRARCRRTRRSRPRAGARKAAGIARRRLTSSLPERRGSTLRGRSAARRLLASPGWLRRLAVAQAVWRRAGGRRGHRMGRRSWRFGGAGAARAAAFARHLRPGRWRGVDGIGLRRRPAVRDVFAADRVDDLGFLRLGGGAGIHRRERLDVRELRLHRLRTRPSRASVNSFSATSWRRGRRASGRRGDDGRVVQTVGPPICVNAGAAPFSLSMNGRRSASARAAACWAARPGEVHQLLHDLRLQLLAGRRRPQAAPATGSCTAARSVSGRGAGS